MNSGTNVRTSVWERMLPWGMPALLIVGFLIRLLFVGDQGFRNDVATFEAWAISLLDHGFANFYSQTGFADYPPGYFYVLALIGHLWAPLRSHDPGFGILMLLTKLPAIFADLAIGALIYRIGCRFARPVVAFGAAALYVLNPATIYISANWGQVDAFAGLFVLLAAYLLLRSDDRPVGSLGWEIPVAWIALAYSLLIKPQAAAVIPIFLAFAFVDAQRRRARIMGTLLGIVGAFAFTILLTEPFHPSNPIAALTWLLGQYHFGSNVYPYNTVNAFNLWALHGAFWQRDDATTGFLFLRAPQYVWGIGLVIAALALIVWRYVQARTAAALLEACTLALLAFFILATRMHERYSFDALLFAVACVPLARRYLWGALVLSLVLYANLVYSLQYLSAVSSQTPGANPLNLWGPITIFYALLAVGTFFVLGYLYLGVDAEERAPDAKPSAASLEAEAFFAQFSARAREWFDPTEGLARLRAPLDYLVMGALGVASFVLSYVNYWLPGTKIFDEIYFARAAEEYLKNMRIYENTHPPLSKLLVTLSVMLFGGLQHGDNAMGWRFLDVLFGALVVMLLYAFAKRVTGSTLFAAIASTLLIFDGMHFVQSRIATPEGFVVVFSLAAVYAFYRFLIASQVEERAHVVVPPLAFGVAAGVSLLLGAAVVGAWKFAWPPLDKASMIIVALYAALGFYLLARYVLFTRLFGDGSRELTFPDGSYALRSASGTSLHAPDGGTIESGNGGKAKIGAGDISGNRSGALVANDGEVTITYRPDASVTYATPAGSATYAQNEIRTENERERGSSATLWLVIFTVALGLLVSSKWYGVMGFGVSFTALIFVWLQRVVRERRPMLWGNPRGFRLDGALATIVFIAATVYGLVWVPDLVRHSPDPAEIHNFNDVVYRQYSMFEYHDTLKATHPYSSQWWEWPLDYVPIAYYYQDGRTNKSDNNGCCVEEITSMPNPFNMWFGLLAVPIVGFLAWRERRKAYALIVLTYLLQWLPWMKSPRITFAYHFYVDIPLICLCNAIVLQRIWEWAKSRGPNGRWVGIAAVGGVVLAIGLCFVFFYPILSAQPITWNAWHSRMWIEKWIVGPG
ncbi:MAG: phospholipid carrier-dependent glycosyltransferase [bacterium]|nr:phospholipid carrier-dependent glycosyltransferase [bacterium]